MACHKNHYVLEFYPNFRYCYGYTKFDKFTQLAENKCFVTKM